MAQARILALLTAGLLAACSVVPDAERDITILRELPLPPPMAAFVTAEAMRGVLPFADPLPYSGGAPATALGDGGFVVRYDRCDGNWLPRAEHRLHHAGANVRVGTARLPGHGANAQRSIRLEIRSGARSGPGASTVAGTLPRDLTSAFDTALARAVARHSAAAAPLGHFEHARQSAQAGEIEHARHLRDHAALATADPALRAFVLRELSAPTSGTQARQDGIAHLVAGDLAAARTLLHTARRNAPDPGSDYVLLWQLHRDEARDTSALASALLAREYDRMDATAMALELRRSNLAELVHKLGLPLETGPMERIHALPAAAPAK